MKKLNDCCEKNSVWESSGLYMYCTVCNSTHYPESYIDWDRHEDWVYNKENQDDF